MKSIDRKLRHYMIVDIYTEIKMIYEQAGFLISDSGEAITRRAIQENIRYSFGALRIERTVIRLPDNSSILYI
jgi:hypothetical protein